MVKPLVSVIVPTFNRASFVVRAVDSVLAQGFTDYELIVVDDCSTDNTLEALSRFQGSVSVCLHSTNQGVAAARNTGIRMSSGVLIAFLDSDDYWLPHKLETQVDFFERNPEAVACQGQEIWIKNGKKVMPKKRHLKQSGDIFEPSLRLCLVSPSAVMIKRRLLEEVGLFDEALPACEDYDLWLRISARYPIYLIDEEQVVREAGHGGQLSASFRGMDRFRVRSLVNLIKSGTLNERQIFAAMKELSRKCRIYGNGCVKRGRMQEGRFYLDLPRRLQQTLREGNESLR